MEHTERLIKKENKTWVTSAEVTQITTTAEIRQRPALYFQVIAKEKSNPRWVSSRITEKQAKI